MSPLSSRGLVLVSLLWSLGILGSGGGLHVRSLQASQGPTVWKLMLGVWSDMEILDHLKQSVAITGLPLKRSGGGSQT